MESLSSKHQTSRTYAPGRPAVPFAMIGSSQRMLDLRKLMERCAVSSSTVLVQGDSGTGKELVCRALHAHSPRCNGPYISVNCGAITSTLLESELFRHEKGAFAGAVRAHQGKFEVASGGTLFLDEVGEMELSMQAKVLRALEGYAFSRVGGVDYLSFDVRVVAATNRNLRGCVESGQFRKDLYYRLAVLLIEVPPLRDRIEDIPDLAEHFRVRFNEKVGRSIEGFTSNAMAALCRYKWPGNIRELQNTIERSVTLANRNVLDVEDIALGPVLTSASRDESNVTSSPEAPIRLKDVELRHIHSALAYTGGNLSEAARLLGINRETLRRRLA